MTLTFAKRLSWFKGLFTVYTTARVVRIDSKVLAITYVALMVTVWAAFLRSYQLDLRRIYQKECNAKGQTLTKVKGIISTESYTDNELAIQNPDMYRRVWDTEDIHKQQGTNGFFITTNVIITANQTRGRCSLTKGSQCQGNIECALGKQNSASTGIFDGICVKSNHCQVSAWCPMEEDVLPLRGDAALLTDTKSFTVLIKNTVEFPDCEEDAKEHSKYVFKRRNILDNFTANYLRDCRHHPTQSPYCPIFNLGDIVESAKTDYDQAAIAGGVFRILITWNCDFDWGSTIRECLPKYSFTRMDVADTGLSPGYNFRTAVFHEEDRRTLTKRYGFKFIVETAGVGRKFDFLLLVLTIGASIGLFALAPLVCDFLFDLFCFLKTLGGPCHGWFKKYTEEIRYQGINAHLVQNQVMQLSVIDGGQHHDIPEISTSKPL